MSASSMPALRLLRTSPLLDAETIPPAMLDPYELKSGIWGRIRVTEGRLTLRFLESGRDQVIEAGRDGIMCPRQPCRVELAGPVRFDVAYFGESPAPGSEASGEDEWIQAATAASAKEPLIAKVPGKVAPPGLDEEVVRRVVDAFYDRIRADRLLEPVFSAAIPAERWPIHLRTMYDFWSSLLLGTGRFQGRPVPKHMALPGLGDAHFIRWLALFRETVEAICHPRTAALFVDRAERVAQSFRLSLAFHRGEDTTRIVPLRAGEGAASPAERRVEHAAP
ncbi:DUF1971 domain-containing protein [Enterovirga rhinocerotis]|nr:DUF1971 domain-containing protein [Enterovirga rhinocerotis]